MWMGHCVGNTLTDQFPTTYHTLQMGTRCMTLSFLAFGHQVHGLNHSWNVFSCLFVFLALAHWLKLLIIIIYFGIWSGLTNPSEAGICSQVPAGLFVLQEPCYGSICIHECPWKCNFTSHGSKEQFQ